MDPKIQRIVPLQYRNIPDSTLDALYRYIDNKIQPGHFLTAVICNDLVNAVSHADSKNYPELRNIVQYLYNHCPATCWGSDEKMQEWLKS